LIDIDIDHGKCGGS